jgi:hypothetical protein
MYRKLLPAILVLGFLSCQQKNKRLGLDIGTSIIAIASADSVWIAADSKATDMNDKGELVHTGRACKLGEKNDVFFAFAGHTGYTHKSIFFDAWTLAAYASGKTKDFEEAVRIFSDTVLKAEDAMLNSLYTRNEKKAIETILAKEALLEFCFVSFKNGERMLATGKVKVQPDGDKWKLDFERETPPDQNELTIIKLGFTERAAFYLYRNKAKVENSESLPALLRKGIELQAAEMPTMVDTPVNMLVIYNNGHNWLNRISECAE